VITKSEFDERGANGGVLISEIIKAKIIKTCAS
jgi:hypothetical protein